MTNRIIKILIIVALVLAAGKAWAWSGSGTSASDPILIESRTDIETLALNVNNGTHYYGVYFKVTTDISEVTTVIGTSSKPFRGNFDGNGKTLTITRTVSSDNNGLFGYVGDGANIHDVNVTGTITCNAGTKKIGGIVGYAKGSSGSRITISKCRSDIELSGEGNNIGGIVGYSEYTDITECKNLGNLQTSNDTYSEGIGGIVGYATNSSISNCRNQGNITSISNVGGIAGDIWTNNNIRECENSGDITSTKSNSSSYAGGIVGYSTTNGYVNSCFNTGDIIVSGYDAGGIVGYAYYGHSIRNCGNTGAITSTCTVTSEYWGNGGIGGIIGHHFGQGSRYETVENCYNLGNVTGTSMIKVGGIAGQSYRGVKILNCCNSGIVKGYNTDYSGALVGHNNSNAYLEYSYYIHSTTHTRNDKIGSSGESTHVTNCASFEGSCSGGYIFKSPTSITVNSISYTRIIDALNAWIGMQSNPSDYYRIWLPSSSEYNCAPMVQPLCQTLDPPILTVTPHYQRNELSWGEVANALSYNLVYNSSSLYSGGNRTFTHSGLTNGTEYCYQIMAVGDGTTYCTDNPRSDPQCGTPNCSHLERPTIEIRAEDISDRTVKVRWSGVSGANSYTLYWGVNDPNVSTENVWKKTSISSSLREYDVERLTNGQLYKFAIMPVGSIAEDECEDNPLSSTVSATPNCE